MALMWLDLARYADTHGYHIDSHRDMFRWRDWVIRAFNVNMPYDRFLTEQLAGDLLPNPTTDQLVATGFNRNHPINFEGGAIPEEYQTAYVADRVDTTATVTMGLTLRCAQCHDHKYDPVAMDEYYKFFALFNNIDEEGLDGMRGNAKPFIPAVSPAEQAQLDALSSRIDGLTRECKSISGSILAGLGNVNRGPIVSDDYRWVLGDRPLSVGTKSKDGLAGSMTRVVEGPNRMPATKDHRSQSNKTTTVCDVLVESADHANRPPSATHSGNRASNEYVAVTQFNDVDTEGSCRLWILSDCSST